MEIDVQLAVISDNEKQWIDGVVQTDTSMKKMLEDIVNTLQLGDAENWILAVAPARPETALSQYTPTDGDTLLLVKKSVAQEGSSFRRKETPQQTES